MKNKFLVFGCEFLEAQIYGVHAFLLKTKNSKLKTSQKGFTLLELMIAMTLFVVVLVSFIGLFMSAISEQQKNLEKITLLNSASYLLEYMSRSIRMAEKDPGATCIDLNMNYKHPNAGNDSLQFLQTEFDAGAGGYVPKCRRFYFDVGAGKIKIMKSTDNTQGNLQLAIDLTPGNLTIAGMRFVIQGDGQVAGSPGDPTGNLQPAVTISINLRTNIASPQELKVQTTVSQRELDIEY